MKEATQPLLPVSQHPDEEKQVGNPQEFKKQENSRIYKYHFSLASLITINLYGAIMNECWLFTSQQMQEWVGGTVFISTLGALITGKMVQCANSRSPSYNTPQINGGLLGTLVTSFLFTGIVGSLYGLINHNIISQDALIITGTVTVASLTFIALGSMWKFRNQNVKIQEDSWKETLIKICKSGVIGFLFFSGYLDSLGFADRFLHAALMRFINDWTFNKLDPGQLTFPNVNATGAVVGVFFGAAAIVANSSCWAGRKAGKLFRHIQSTRLLAKRIAELNIVTPKIIKETIDYLNTHLFCADKFGRPTILDAENNYIFQKDPAAKSKEEEKNYAHSFLLYHMTNLKSAGQFILKLSANKQTFKVLVAEDSDDEYKTEAKKAKDKKAIKKDDKQTNNTISDYERNRLVDFLKQIKLLYPALTNAADKIINDKTSPSQQVPAIREKLTELLTIYLGAAPTTTSGSIPSILEIIDQLILGLQKAEEVVEANVSTHFA